MPLLDGASPNSVAPLADTSVDRRPYNLRIALYGQKNFYFRMRILSCIHFRYAFHVSRRYHFSILVSIILYYMIIELFEFPTKFANAKLPILNQCRVRMPQTFSLLPVILGVFVEGC